MTASVIPPTVQAAEADRPKALLIGSILGSAGAAMVVFSLLGAYLAERGRFLAENIDEEGVVTQWLNARIIPLSMPSVIAGTLGLSLFFMFWAIVAARREDRANTLVALSLTAVFGLAVINGSAFLWGTSGLEVRESAQALLLYSVMGTHLLMVGIGVVAIILTIFRVIGAAVPSREIEALSAVAVLWTVTTAVYVVLWYAVYITK